MRSPGSSVLLILIVSAASAQTGKPPRALAEFSAAIESVAAAASPAVVQLEVRSRSLAESAEGRRAGYFVEQSASGSGVIVDASGYIVTNAHVVEGARRIDVSVVQRPRADAVPDHRHYPGRIVGLDKETDLAVVKIDAEKLPTLAFLDSSKLRQGQLALALGSPLGLENSLTVGYISATNRQLSPPSPVSYIQTDAPINPGNSGGPLLDIEGRIAGINTMIMSQSGGSEGIGFAIPANVVRWVAAQLREQGRVRRGVIGVVPQDISPTMAAALGLAIHPGVVLGDVVPHGAAEAAGLQPGDIVLAADGKAIAETRQLTSAIIEHAIGDKVVLDVLRGAEKLQFPVAVVERPRSPSPLVELLDESLHLVRELGIMALPIDEKVTAILPDLRRMSGVVVAAIPAEHAAFNPGLQAGDAIYRINATLITSVEDLRAAVAGKKSGTPLVLQVEREGRLSYLAFELE